eukprot:TRINITY_DN80856_c0_g1_i1.p1 TRINITY_DN80856_c0_g1~~TRINITY_DN80856_c0_g1_i1.p1  ORF type:complete len:472 (-),score=58.50 TRINITY_DN80856_c0_g1_i1:139-1497(-)
MAPIALSETTECSHKDLSDPVEGERKIVETERHEMQRTALWVARGLSVLCPCGRSCEADKSEKFRDSLLDDAVKDAKTPRTRSALVYGADGICVLEPGETFEDFFDVGTKIGEGTFGKVFACREKSRDTCDGPALDTGQDSEEDALCVKVVPLHGAKSARRMELDEHATLTNMFRQMLHPNVVQYHHFMQTDEALYIVMERCCGLDLPDHLTASGGSLTIEDVYGISEQILEALGAVHDLQLMHRDVKPENFRFLDRTSKCLKLLDFGFAKPYRSAGVAAQHTVTGTMLYAAPEVFDGFYCEKCDMWSAGIVLYFLLSGQMPFETSDLAILRSMFKDPVLTGTSLIRGEAWQKVPSAAIRLVRRLLSVDPAERPDSHEAHRELLKLMQVGLKRTQSFGDSLPGSLTPLTRSHNNLQELKRTYYVWNLEDQAGLNSDDESPTASGSDSDESNS